MKSDRYVQEYILHGAAGLDGIPPFRKRGKAMSSTPESLVGILVVAALWIGWLNPPSATGLESSTLPPPTAQETFPGESSQPLAPPRDSLVLPGEGFGLAEATETPIGVAMQPEWVAASEKAIDRGIAFLLARQNPNGSWGSARNTKGINVYAPIPGAHHAFRAAVTGLCVAALMESGRQSPELHQAITRAEEWLLRELPHLRRATPDAIYNIWGHAYAIQGLLRLLGRPGLTEDQKLRLRELITNQIELLRRYEVVDGGWAYYDFKIGTQRPAGASTSFLTATVLVALHEAREMGFEIPSDVIARAIGSLKRQQKPDFTYLYTENFRFYPAQPINRPAGSLGRSQACNLALRLWGDEQITDAVIENWLTRLIQRNGWLDMGRKRPIPHEAWFQIAGYFFYYGHYYAGLCIEQLPVEKREPYQRELAQVLVRLQEPDGSWWDFPFYDYHQQYGTAFAIMTLVRCRPQNADSRLAAK